MLNRLNKYLLTHYPLLWNTQAIPVIAVSLIMHLLFFLAGYASLDLTAFGSDYYSLSSAETSGMYTLSCLVSVAILIGWLVFFLRNNPFKEFYILDKGYLAKQFFLAWLILFVSVTFFHSFRWGSESRTRSFTSKNELVHEANILNLAGKFIPNQRTNYFKLNSCSFPDSTHVVYRDAFNYSDTTLEENSTEPNRRIRNALRDSDAFRYETFCEARIFVEGMDTNWVDRGNRWLADGQKDSVRYVIREVQKLADKYSIEYRIRPDSLVAMAFGDSLHTVKHTISYVDESRITEDIVYDNKGVAIDAGKSSVRLPGYINMLQIENALRIVDTAHYRMRSEDELTFQTILLYATLFAAILILCYRMFTRKVFLVGVVGTIVWTILLVGMGVGSGSETGILIFLLLLCIGSLVCSGIRDFGKTLRAVLLCWHIWIVPFVVMILISLIEESYNRYNLYIPGSMVYFTDAQLQEKYPVAYWVSNHDVLLIRLNLLLVAAYTAFVFTRLARKWQASPEE